MNAKHFHGSPCITFLGPVFLEQGFGNTCKAIHETALFNFKDNCHRIAPRDFFHFPVTLRSSVGRGKKFCLLKGTKNSMCCGFFHQRQRAWANINHQMSKKKKLYLNQHVITDTLPRSISHDTHQPWTFNWYQVGVLRKGLYKYINVNIYIDTVHFGNWLLEPVVSLQPKSSCPVLNTAREKELLKKKKL